MSIYLRIDIDKFFRVAYCLDETENRLGYPKFDKDYTGLAELEKLVGGSSIPDNDNILLGMKALAITGFPSMSSLKVRDINYTYSILRAGEFQRYRSLYTLFFQQAVFTLLIPILPETALLGICLNPPLEVELYIQQAITHSWVYYKFKCPHPKVSNLWAVYYRPLTVLIFDLKE